MSAQAACEISLMKFKATNSCVCFDLSGLDLGGAKLKGTNLTNVLGLDEATHYKTIMPWGEDNSAC